VCGDIHGQYYDLINIFKINGMPSEENPYLFNGDFVDRGSFCAEVMCCMLSWKICLPQHFHMNRGNHEAKTLTSMYGFSGEITHKYDKRVYDLFCQMFQHIPLCHILNKQVMVNHGGLFSRDDISLEDIKKINRVREPPDNGPMCELMWSDPDDKDGRHPSKRGCGIAFGPDVAAKFLEKNGLKLLVRAHEVKQEGFEYQAGGKVVTVFSAPNYCDQMGNKGAYCRFQGATMEPKITSFEKSPHPNLRPMQYASFGSMFS
jgi:serine/threonine-protein phosphatase 5